MRVTTSGPFFADPDRIRAKSYTDNVVDLIAGRLKRFSATTQEALKQLACLGNVAEISTLALVHGDTEEAMRAALWEGRGDQGDRPATSDSVLCESRRGRPQHRCLRISQQG